ncbi:MAG: phosphate ABC transporter, permease protein PstA, partial [Mobilicoccus sp.]|nr:phosphate ABC transporter, permease protein PstA [Mobilicoccus sp.]
MTRTDDTTNNQTSSGGATAASASGGTSSAEPSIGTRGTLSQNVRRLIALGALAVAVGLSFLFGWGLNPVAIIVLTALVYCVAIYIVSRSVEGGRHAMDRLVTGIVTSMFLLALMPLVSVIYEVILHGLARFDWQFFTHSMRGVLGDGGGAYHALVGTLMITALASAVSIPVGILAAIYLVEYGGKSRLARGLTFFVDVMTGIPSIVAGLFA